MFEDVIKEAMSLYDVWVDGIDDTREWGFIEKNYLSPSNIVSHESYDRIMELINNSDIPYEEKKREIYVANKQYRKEIEQNNNVALKHVMVLLSFKVMLVLCCIVPVYS